MAQRAKGVTVFIWKASNATPSVQPAPFWAESSHRTPGGALSFGTEGHKKNPVAGATGFGKGGLGRSEGLLERCGGFEAYRLGCVDLHGLPGFGVAAHAGSAVFDFERSKADELDFAIATDSIGDGVENGGDSVFGSTLGGVFAQCTLDGFDQFGFIHGLSVLGEVKQFVKLKGFPNFPCFSGVGADLGGGWAEKGSAGIPEKSGKRSVRRC